MICGFCGTANPDDEHRCLRCARRLRSGNARRAPEIYPLRSSAVRALAPQPAEPDSPADTRPEAAKEPMAPVQPSLFSASDLPRVIPFEALVGRLAKRSKGNQKSSGKGASKPAGPSAQQAFYFEETAPPELVRYCDAPVARLIHRVTAATLDASLILIACGIFVLVQYFGPWQVIPSAQVLPYYAASSGFFLFLYKLLWCLAGTDSPGMRWIDLRLLNFDGHPPTQSQRLQRLVFGCFSVLPAGLGLYWAIVDEETLSWHDHMSRTFVTPKDAR